MKTFYPRCLGRVVVIGLLLTVFGVSQIYAADRTESRPQRQPAMWDLFGGPLAAEAHTAAMPTGKKQSGYYVSAFPLLLGVDEKQGIVTGSFEGHGGWDERRSAPMFHCTFYLFGEVRGDTFPITTWYPGREDGIQGRLTFLVHNGRPEVRIKLDTEHGGCWNVQHFADEKGAEFALEKPGRWAAIRVVSAKRAYFHTSADPKTKRKAYVIAGDVLRVFNIQDGWLDAEYGTERITRGWIKEADVFPAAPFARHKQ